MKTKMKKNTNLENNIYKKHVEDEIDLKIFFSLIFRNKVLIGTSALITLVISFFYSLTLKKIWRN